MERKAREDRAWIRNTIIVEPWGFRKTPVDDPGTELLRVRWADVREVVAWKDDILTQDLIKLGFRVGDAPKYLAVDENESGWNELVVAMEAEFPDLEAGWWRSVAFPPFKTNWATVWGEFQRDQGSDKYAARRM